MTVYVTQGHPGRIKTSGVRYNHTAQSEAAKPSKALRLDGLVAAWPQPIGEWSGSGLGQYSGVRSCCLRHPRYSYAINDNG